METLRAQVTAVLGPTRAGQWLHAPHAYLGGQSPWDAGQTPEGLEKLKEMIGALLDGAFL